jgi:hypothetical protein
MEWTGGCQCGQIRYALRQRPRLIEYCHCRTCRRSVGAPVMAWAGVPLGGFKFTKGDVTNYASSESVRRSFCSRCGTSITIFSEAFPEDIYVSVTSLDDPSAMPPEIHIWRSHRLDWFDTSDELPKYVSFKSDDETEE